MGINLIITLEAHFGYFHLHYQEYGIVREISLVSNKFNIITYQSNFIGSFENSLALKTTNQTLYRHNSQFLGMLLYHNLDFLNHIENKINTTKAMYAKLFSLKSNNFHLSANKAVINLY